LTLRADGVVRFSERVGEPDDTTEGWSWFEKRMVIEGAALQDAHTRLELEIEAPTDLDRPPRLVLVAVEIYRYPLGNLFEVALGQPGDEPFVADGFAPQPDDAVELPFPTRWTGPYAAIPLPVKRSEGPARLRVEYFVGARPREVKPALPRFLLNGRALTGRKTEERVRFGRPGEGSASAMEVVASLQRVTEVFDVPSGVVRGALDVLEIESETWVPAESGVSSDTRELGVMLHRIALENGLEDAGRGRFRSEE
jgi:hypothetical protein